MRQEIVGVQVKKAFMERSIKKKAIASYTMSLYPITREKPKILLKKWGAYKIIFQTSFPEHNNLFRINFSGMYYFQFWIFLSKMGF